MTPEQKKHIVKINKRLDAARGGGGTLVVVETADTNELIEAVQLILADRAFQKVLQQSKTKLDIQTNDDLYTIAHAYLHMLLMKRDYESAATLLWGADMFTCEPRAVKLVWDTIRKTRMLNIMGASSQGKSFNAAVYLLLDWVADPEYTMVRVMSVKEDHLKRNLFAGLQRLFSSSAIPLPGIADTESIATTTGKKAGFGIFITTMSRAETAPPSIKGAHPTPRPRHPIFGDLTRLRFLIDEAQEAPPKVFTEVSNLFSSMSAGDMEHIKIITAANPANEFSEYGKHCKNSELWEQIQTKLSPIDEWMSDTGWNCLRLNALKSENITTGKEIYSGFMTKTGLDMKLRSYSGDEDHFMMWSEVYGMFPPHGNVSTIIYKQHVARSYGEWLFKGPTTSLAGMDVALTGDLPVMATGRAGMAVAWIDYNGERHELKEPTWKLQIDTVGIMSRGDTQDLADDAMERLKLLGVEPENFAIDRTGNGQGVHDNVRRQWKNKVDGMDTRSTGAQVPVSIIGVHYSEGATQTKIAEEDTKLPKELYQDLCSELWYATGKYFEYDMIRVGRGVDGTTIEELISRRGGPQSGRSKLFQVETKDMYKSRGHPSPDRADAFTLLVHAARMSVPDLKPKAPDTELEVEYIPNVLDEAKNASDGGLSIAQPMDMGGEEGPGFVNHDNVDWWRD